MPNRTTPHTQRVEIIERRCSGQSIQQIAEEMQLNPYTVRKWWRRYRDGGWEGVKPRPSGPPRQGALSQFDPIVKYVVLHLKRTHPGWGLDVLLLEMSRRPSLAGKRLPKRTAVHNYLKAFYPRLCDDRRLRVRRPKPTATSAREVHESWQMDFKGPERLGEVGYVAPLLICDELTSAPLAGQVYAAHRNCPIATTREVQASLRDVFAQWGLPTYLRMDRDPIWVGSSRLEWPGTLLLWLVGLGITPIINRPHRPTDNAQVERLGRTWRNHVALGANCLSLAHAQSLTDQAWHDRRTLLPSRNPHCRGVPPLRVHPDLAHPRRFFSHDQEAALFDIRRVHHYLAQWKWERKVDRLGCISMADCNRLVSRDHVDQVVKVRFDPGYSLFVAFAVDGAPLASFSLPVIAKDYILGGTELVN